MASESDTTFATLDGVRSAPPAQREEGWPLEEWYARVRELPLNALGAGDIAKACRQDVWLDYTVPRALDLLAEDFLAGDLYDGELVVSLRSVPAGFWEKHLDLAQRLSALIENGKALLDDDEQGEVEELMRVIKAR
jgi:hypothetical protein